VTIFNGVSIREVVRSPEDINAPLRLAYVGRLVDAEKGVMHLPEIMNQVRAHGVAATLDVIGKGPDEGRLRRRIGQLELEATICLRGAIANDEIHSHLSRVDCLLMPSRMEGFPNAAVEAMAAGCVPIVHDIRGSLSAIVEDGESGLVVPVGDTQAFAERIVRVAHDRQLLESMRDAALDRVKEEYSLEVAVSKYAQVLGEAMNGIHSRTAPRSIEDFRIAPVFRKKPYHYLPAGLKNRIRQWLFSRGIPA